VLLAPVPCCCGLFFFVPLAHPLTVAPPCSHGATSPSELLRRATTLPGRGAGAARAWPAVADSSCADVTEDAGAHVRDLNGLACAVRPIVPGGSPAVPVARRRAGSHRADPGRAHPGWPVRPPQRTGRSGILPGGRCAMRPPTRGPARHAQATCRHTQNCADAHLDPAHPDGRRRCTRGGPLPPRRIPHMRPACGGHVERLRAINGRLFGGACPHGRSALPARAVGELRRDAIVQRRRKEAHPRGCW
jgi:hypothetical protein